MSKKEHKVALNYAQDTKRVVLNLNDQEGTLSALADTFVAREGEGENIVRSSLDQPIASTNKGFKLLLSMGWNRDSGLGAYGDGRTEPVPIGRPTGLGHLGLGVREAEAEIVESERFSRKLLEIEREETEELKQRRMETKEVLEEREESRTQLFKKFFCIDCSKQFTNTDQYERHLESRGHLHVVRGAEARARAGKKLNRKRKKEDQFAAAMRLATSNQKLNSQPPPSPSPPHGSSISGPAEARAPTSFSFSEPAKKGPVSFSMKKKSNLSFSMSKPATSAPEGNSMHMSTGKATAQFSVDLETPQSNPLSNSKRPSNTAGSSLAASGSTFQINSFSQLRNASRSKKPPSSLFLPGSQSGQPDKPPPPSSKPFFKPPPPSFSGKSRDGDQRLRNLERIRRDEGRYGDRHRERRERDGKYRERGKSRYDTKTASRDTTRDSLRERQKDQSRDGYGGIERDRGDHNVREIEDRNKQPSKKPNTSSAPPHPSTSKHKVSNGSHDNSKEKAQTKFTGFTSFGI